MNNSSSASVDFASITRQDLDQADDQGYLSQYDKGLSEDLVRQISADKKEPAWVLDLRLRALSYFFQTDMPDWGPDLSGLDLSDICYFATAVDQPNQQSWDDVPDQIKQTFARLRIPEAEQAVLAGVGAQYDSETVYHSLKEQWSQQGVIFMDFDVALQEHEDLVRQYFGKCISYRDHKFSALHYAIFSGGTFLYVPPGVKITQPLQAYFRMNARNGGQFEHTLIIADQDSDVSYIEGCSAPKFGSNSLHAGGVEIFVKNGARARYSSVENWSPDTYNLNTKRAIVEKKGRIEWVGGNLGSGTTMLYPCSILAGDHSRADHLGVAFANSGQQQDVGTKVIISGSHCRASVISKSLAKGGGSTIYRGLVTINPSAEQAVVNVECDTLMLDNQSLSDTIPTIKCHNSTAQINHEACAGKISAEVLCYFRSRGIDDEVAKGMIVNGFLDEIVKVLPLEYASELNRLIELEMEGSIG